MLGVCSTPAGGIRNRPYRPNGKECLRRSAPEALSSSGTLLALPALRIRFVCTRRLAQGEPAAVCACSLRRPVARARCVFLTTSKTQINTRHSARCDGCGCSGCGGRYRYPICASSRARAVSMVLPSGPLRERPRRRRSTQPAPTAQRTMPRSTLRPQQPSNSFSSLNSLSCIRAPNPGPKSSGGSASAWML